MSSKKPPAAVSCRRLFLPFFRVFRYDEGKKARGIGMYDKRLYVFDGNTPREAVIRNYTTDDFADLIRVQQESFPPPFPSELWWNEEQLTNHVTLFPEGALCVEVEGRIVGSMTGLIVDFDPAHADHTWEEITDGGYIRNHRPDGNTLYVVDICVSPPYRKLGLGKCSCSRCMKSSSISALTGCSAAGGCLATIDMRLNYRRKPTSTKSLLAS
ncbi:Acetyltransferase [Geobacillus sp. WSUCF1]|nr:Acetyltransferase [Geobacillus sp. WSUCF1]